MREAGQVRVVDTVLNVERRSADWSVSVRYVGDWKDGMQSAMDSAAKDKDVPGEIDFCGWGREANVDVHELLRFKKCDLKR